MNVSLGPMFDRFVDELVASGVYQSRSEVLREGLRLLKEREELRRLRIAELRKQIAVGLEQVQPGKVAGLDMEATKAEGRRRLAERQRRRR